MSLLVEKSKTRPVHRAQTEETEAVILNAARKLFLQYGYGKVTMDEIAADAGMGKASLYYYFPTKDHLFAAVIGSSQRRFIDDMKRIIAEEQQGPERIRKYVAQRFKYYNTLLSYRFMDMDPVMKHKSIMVEIFTRFRKEELDLLRRIFRQGKKQGEFAVDCPEQTAEVFLHIFHGLRLRFLQFAPRLIPFDQEGFGQLQEEMRIATEIFLRGVGTNHHPLPLRSKQKPERNRS